jgi:WD40 repeat protein
VVLAIPSYDGTITLWNISNPATPLSLTNPLNPGSGKVRDIAFSRDGHTLATTGEDKTVHLWDITDLRHPRPATTLRGETAAVHAAAFSVDGSLVAAGGADKTARVWRLKAPTPIPESLTGHTGLVREVVFSRDGNTLMTGSEDDTVRIWDLDLSHSVARICSTTQGVLTREQWAQLIPELPYAPACP